MTARVDGPYCAIHDAAHRPCDPRDQLDAGVLSSDAPIVLSPVDADRVAAMIEERPGPTEAMQALFAPRRPCAGWAPIFDAYHLPGTIECLANEDDFGDGYIWALRADTSEGRLILIAGDRQVYGTAPTIEAAQLAAEDELRAIAVEILRAVGA